MMMNQKESLQQLYERAEKQRETVRNEREQLREIVSSSRNAPRIEYGPIIESLRNKIKDAHSKRVREEQRLEVLLEKRRKSKDMEWLRINKDTKAQQDNVYAISAEERSLTLELDCMLFESNVQPLLDFGVAMAPMRLQQLDDEENGCLHTMNDAKSIMNGTNTNRGPAVIQDTIDLTQTSSDDDDDW
jgi:hypothetical protein